MRLKPRTLTKAHNTMHLQQPNPIIVCMYMSSENSCLQIVLCKKMISACPSLVCINHNCTKLAGQDLCYQICHQDSLSSKVLKLKKLTDWPAVIAHHRSDKTVTQDRPCVILFTTKETNLGHPQRKQNQCPKPRLYTHSPSKTAGVGWPHSSLYNLNKSEWKILIKSMIICPCEPTFWSWASPLTHDATHYIDWRKEWLPRLGYTPGRNNQYQAQSTVVQ